ncbi:MAG: hypothetical protein OEZ44_12055 [Candidatus Bathyarchaeota archaeon]|nr:hypothetical protein [Candidatus Bathyarchaeota archaeon]
MGSIIPANIGRYAAALEARARSLLGLKSLLKPSVLLSCAEDRRRWA